MQVDVLGSPRVCRDGVPVEVPGARLRALLVRLALAAGRPVLVGRLVDALWPDEPPADEANALQSLVSRLRRALGDARLVQQSDAGYRLAVDPDEVDAIRFARLAGAGRAQLRGGDPAAASATLHEALALWRGPLPAGVPIGDAVQLEEQRLDALADRVDADLALGRHDELVAELEALVAAHPLRERFAGQLMAALAGSGRQAEALAGYERVRRRLADELGVDPSAELRERHVAVLRGALPPPRRPSPERTNLRASLTSFLGRDDELAVVDALLDIERLVTILGPGGAGKTRLATEAASRRVEALPDGVWFVELAPVTDPAEVAHTTLASLRLREPALRDRRTPTRPGRDALDRLLDALADRAALLVMDNCEHVLDAVAQLVNTLLARCPQLRVLATSREPLGIVGETLAPLAPLPTPPPGVTAAAALELPAVQLFAERAAAVRPGFVVDESTVGSVVEIVRRLDGLPLAIELAAARLRTLPVGEIAARLSDRFRLLTGGSRTALPRHRTLQAVVDWSWDLLTPAERLLAERMAVFPAGVTPATAAGVCADERLPAEEVADLLAALVDRSLLQLADDDRPRYRMLETIREYGTDRLAERGELAELRRTHARYFADLAARADAGLRGRDQLVWLRRLEAEHDNVLAALRTLADDGDAAVAATLALALTWYWTMTDRHAEAATWLGIVLNLPGPIDRDVRVVAQAVHAMNSVAAIELGGVAGDDPRGGLRAIVDDLAAVDDTRWPTVAVLKPMLLFFAGDSERSGVLLDAAVAHSDPWVRATARSLRARLAENAGDVGQARADAETAYDAFAALGDTWGVSFVLPLTAQLRAYDGDLRGALAAIEETRDLLALLTTSDADLMVALQLADLRIRLDDLTGAREAASAAATLAMERGAREMSAIALAMAASVERLGGDLAAAVLLQSRAEERLADAPRTFDVDHGGAIVNAGGAMLDLTHGDVDAAAARLAVAYPAARATRDMPIAAAVGVAAAALAAALDRPADAARLLGAAARLRGADDPTSPDVARLTEWATAALGPDGYREAWDAGWRLSAAEALDAADPAYLRLDAQVRRA